MTHARVALVMIVLAAGTAHAQVVFPAESEWIALRCDGVPMFDPFQDQAGAIDERDIVGDAGAPAGMRASDDTNLFLRIRVDADPAPNGNVSPFAWGMQFDLDGDLQTYELMIVANGIGGATEIFVLTNTTTTVPNDPADPADQPAADTFAFAANGRTVTATGSNFGNTADFFVELAVPWATLIPLGLDRDTPTHVWAGTSSSEISLDGDFACHDGTGGPATLDTVVSDPTTGDPTLDPVGGTGRLEGGGGCATGYDGSAFLALLLLWRTRRERRFIVR